MVTINFMTTTNIQFPILKQTNRYNFPYCLDINTNTNEVYFIDRDYNYMGFFTKSLRDMREDSFERHYIYNDGSKPWKLEGKKEPPCKNTGNDYINAINKILNLCKGKKIMWYDFNYIDKRREYFNLKNKLNNLKHLNPKLKEKIKVQRKIDELLDKYNKKYLDPHNAFK